MLRQVALAATCVMLSHGAQAATISWTATLDQTQEVPTPVAVPGASGSAFGTVDTVTGLLEWSLSFEGLSGAPVGAHFHAPALPGATAPVVVSIGDISGLDSPSVGSTTIPLEGVEALLDGLYYINVHTELNPAGEIRGQVSPVPVPAALPLLLVAVGAMGLAARRRA